MWNRLPKVGAQQLTNDSSTYSQILPGDLIFFGQSPYARHHVGIVINNKNNGVFEIVEGNAGRSVNLQNDYITVDKNIVIATDAKRQVAGFGKVLNRSDPSRGNPTVDSLPGVGQSGSATMPGSFVPVGSSSMGSSDLANGFVSQSLTSTDSTLSYLLTGDHALANDIPFIEWI